MSDLPGLYCILEETVSGESMAQKVISKVNARLKFLHQKNKYLTPNLRCLLCIALMQPHFDYACSVWYPNLSKKLKSRIQTSQIKCICFSLQLDKMSHISKRIWNNRLPIKERYNQFVNSIAFKDFNNQCPHFLNAVFVKAPESSSSLRNTYQKLQQPFRKTNRSMHYLSLVQHCGIKSPKKSKEQLT